MDKREDFTTKCKKDTKVLEFLILSLFVLCDLWWFNFTPLSANVDISAVGAISSHDLGDGQLAKEQTRVA